MSAEPEVIYATVAPRVAADDASAARSRRMGIVCTALTIANGAVLIALPVSLWCLRPFHDNAAVVVMSSPGFAYLLLAVFIWMHRAGAVDIAAVLSTTLSFVLLLGGTIAVRTHWLIAIGLWCWAILPVVLVWKLYFFQRILRPPSARPRSAFPVIMGENRLDEIPEAATITRDEA